MILSNKSGWQITAVMEDDKCTELLDAAHVNLQLHGHHRTLLHARSYGQRVKPMARLCTMTIGGVGNNDLRVMTMSMHLPAHILFFCLVGAKT